MIYFQDVDGVTCLMFAGAMFIAIVLILFVAGYLEEKRSEKEAKALFKDFITPQQDLSYPHLFPASQPLTDSEKHQLLSLQNAVLTPQQMVDQLKAQRPMTTEEVEDTWPII